MKELNSFEEHGFEIPEFKGEILAKRMSYDGYRLIGYVNIDDVLFPASWKECGEILNNDLHRYGLKLKKKTDKELLDEAFEVWYEEHREEPMNKKKDWLRLAWLDGAYVREHIEEYR